jgi:hypothetical protein
MLDIPARADFPILRLGPLEAAVATPLVPIPQKAVLAIDIINQLVSPLPDIEQVLREKKPFILRCMLDGIKQRQGRMVIWNRFTLSVSIT